MEGAYEAFWGGSRKDGMRYEIAIQDRRSLRATVISGLWQILIFGIVSCQKTDYCYYL